MTSEKHTLLNAGYLQDAIAKPIHRYEFLNDTDVCRLAAATIFGLAKAHAFEQGNKRTAFQAGLFFIEQNGFGYHGATNGMELGLKIIDLCENLATEEELDRYLRKRFIFRMGSRDGFVRKIPE